MQKKVAMYWRRRKKKKKKKTMTTKRVVDWLHRVVFVVALDIGILQWNRTTDNLLSLHLLSIYGYFLPIGWKSLTPPLIVLEGWSKTTGITTLLFCNQFLSPAVVIELPLKEEY
jgi:hypothetical protein